MKTQEDIRNLGKTVEARRLTRRGWKTRSFDLPPEEPLAVHASLLLLLRRFPFGSGQEWKVFMVDFSQNSITVTVRQAGVEKIRVGAGEFSCYRMELLVKVLIFRAKITYWVAEEAPHFLVRHQGKIGPFSKTYVTELEKIGPED